MPLLGIFDSATFLSPSYQIGMLVLYALLLGAFVLAGVVRLKNGRRKMDLVGYAILGVMAVLNLFVIFTSARTSDYQVKMEIVESEAQLAKSQGVEFDPDQDLKVASEKWFDEWWRSSYVQNIWVFDILFVIAWLTLVGAGREYWRNAWRQISHRKLAMVCFGIILLYACIGIIDSLSWRDQAIDADTNTPRVRTAVAAEPGADATDKAVAEFQSRFQGAPVLEERRSLLLRLCKLVGIYQEPKDREDTYSAPLAGVTYKKIQGDYQPLKRTHILGTDEAGQDVFFLALRGIRTGLIIGCVTTLIAVPFAMLFGILAGYFGGWVDDAITYLYAMLGNIPSVLLIAAVVILFGQGLFQLCIVMGITSWVGLCRLLRGETYKLREMEYVQAAEAFGVPRWKIILRHIAPNLMHIVLISSILRFSDLVLAEAVLSYLGIGVGQDTGSWGNMINQATNELARDPIVWWTLAAAFIFMVVLVLAANIFGDAVRDALDPRLRTR